MKQNVPKDFNIKYFLMSEAYTQLRTKLHSEINTNSQSFNLKIPQPSNLLEPKPIGVGKTKAERDACKKAKYTFEANPDKGRDEIVKELVNAPMPNWNVRFRERRRLN